MPRKQWAPFEKVNAADLNANLADQSVMVFATSAARDAAIPTPTVGMESAVQASPDLGAPRFWDGSAWQLVQVGSATPAVWTRGNPDTAATESIVWTGILTNAGWVQVTASMPVDAMITGISVGTANFNAYNNTEWRLGTGASGSEVVRWGIFGITHDGIGGSQLGHAVVPYGVGVPAGTRLAVYYATTSVTPSLNNAKVVVYYTKMASAPTQYEGATTALTSNGSSTAWVQVAATPPLAGGVWVVGFSKSQGSGAAVQFGLGGSGSEVAATPYRDTPDTISNTPSEVWVPPFFWPAGTRLAFRTSTAAATNIATIWRESLA